MDLVLVSIIVVAAVVLFATEKFSMDVSALLVLGVLYVLLRYTYLGKALRATIQDRAFPVGLV